jgi:Uma2 family endonuclease
MTAVKRLPRPLKAEPTIVLGPHLAGIPMTTEDFDAIEEWDEAYRYELIHGVLVVTPLPLESEVDPNEELGHWLRNYQEQHPQGRALNKTLPERYVRTANRRRADRVIWAGLGRMPNPKRDVPTIVVEFVSWGRRNWLRDYVVKRDEYLAAGVKEYWVIDRFRRVLTVYKRQRGKVREQVVTAEGVYQTALLPGFELPLGRLFTIAANWQTAEPE